MPPHLPAVADVEQLEILEGFERQWRSGPPPQLDEYWRQSVQSTAGLDPELRRGLLHDLVALDLEFRGNAPVWNVGVGGSTGAQSPPSRTLARLEDYVSLVPELGPVSELPADLAQAEYRAHLQQGGPMDRADRAARFGPRAAEVDSALCKVEAELAVFREETLPQKGDGTRTPFPSDIAPPGFEIRERLGEGGVGVVYKALQPRLHRLVALKILRAGAHADADAKHRFQLEAEAIARLRHPNIIQIHEVGECRGQPYLALEFAAGGSLQQYRRGEPWPAKAAARVLETLARALQFAHESGVVHRDLKPGNILLADPAPSGEQSQGSTEKRLRLPIQDFPFVVKVSDFGLAKLLEREQAGPTITQDVLGTPSYMAPEQASGHSRHVGPAADVYALGAVLYYLITGRPPFLGETPLDTLSQVLSEEPVRPARLQPKVPRDLETICLKCLEKEPARRIGSAVELADELHRFLVNEPIRSRRTGVWGRLARWSRRNPLAALLSASLILNILAAFALVLWQLQRVDEQRLQVEKKNKELDKARGAEVQKNDELLTERAKALLLKKEFAEQYFFFYRRAWKKGYLDDAREGTQVTEKYWPDDPYELYNVACQYSHLSRLLRERADAGDEPRREESEVSAFDAVCMLSKAFDKGWFEQTDLKYPPVVYLLDDNDLNALRERNEFKRLLRCEPFVAAVRLQMERLNPAAKYWSERDVAFLWAVLAYLYDTPNLSQEELQQRAEYAARAVAELRKTQPTAEFLEELGRQRPEFRSLFDHPEGRKLLAEVRAPKKEQP